MTPEILSDEALAEIEREAERLPTDYNVIEPVLVRDCYEGQEASPWMGHTRPAAEAYASVPALCQTVRALKAENERLENVTIPDSIAGLVHRIDACIRFTVPIQQQTKLRAAINELIFLNAALRDQLAEAHKNVESLSQTIFRSSAATRMRDLCVEKVRAMKLPLTGAGLPDSGAVGGSAYDAAVEAREKRNALLEEVAVYLKSLVID